MLCVSRESKPRRWGPQRCAICAWRRALIPKEAHATDAPPWTCDSACPKILRGLHEKPSPLWRAIIATDRLSSPEGPIRRDDDRKWVRIPLRCESDVQCSDIDYQYEGFSQSPHQTVIAFHNTRLESLVEATPSWTGVANGSGILVDGRLRYGTCTHEGNSGVNVYSDGGLETFGSCTGWVQLEVSCTNTTKLKGGRGHRYCIRGPGGEVCRKAALVALWVLWDETPSLVLLA